MSVYRIYLMQFAQDESRNITSSDLPGNLKFGSFNVELRLKQVLTHETNICVSAETVQQRLPIQYNITNIYKCIYIII